MQPVTVSGPNPALGVLVGRLAAGLATLVMDQVMVHLAPTFDTGRALQLFNDMSSSAASARSLLNQCHPSRSH